MNIPSYVGPLGSAFLFLLVVFGFCFYYCYWKPRRQRNNTQAGKSMTSSTGSPSARSCPSKGVKTYLYEEEFGYGSALSPYSAGYCFHGGFPISTSTATYYQHNTQPVKKYPGPAVAKVVKSGSKQCPKAKPCELRVDMLKEHLHGVGHKPFPVRQLSCESQGSYRNSCHLQVIQESECEEEEKENEDISEINSKGRSDVVWNSIVNQLWFKVCSPRLFRSRQRIKCFMIIILMLKKLFFTLHRAL